MATLAHPLIQPSHTTHISLDALEAGVTLSAAERSLRATGLDWKDLYDVVIPARTLTHRRARKERLSRDESDKLARVLRIYDHTQSIFGSKDKTLSFLRLPKQNFAGRSPLKMLQTDLGGRLVEDMLWGIADGVFV